MSKRSISRREFTRGTAAAGLGLAGSSLFGSAIVGKAFAAPFRKDVPEPLADDEKPKCGAIGVGGIWNYKLHTANAVRPFLNMVALCDVDQQHLETANSFFEGNCDTYENYREVLDRDDIEVVHISVPDHWHAKIAIEALKAGKDVYCEKPLTLTIDEGKQICQVVEETGGVFQVGTQQRSEFNQMFLTAVALVQHGRIGKVKRVTCQLGAPNPGGPFATVDPPPTLNWEKWLGQAPMTEYIPQRCHNLFRWWLEYSGGKITDWGAHHVDIAQWALGYDETGPLTVEPVDFRFPVPMRDGMPLSNSQFNTPVEFNVKCTFAGGEEIVISHEEPNGILFEGEDGDVYVNRGGISGSAYEELAENPLPEDAFTQLCKGKQPYDHMGNFVECVKDRSLPISDVYTHHRAITTCHLANIALRLGRTLNWDAEAQEITGDEQAQAMQSRTPREGYEIEA